LSDTIDGCLPLRRFKQGTRSSEARRQAPEASHEVTAPYRVSYLKSLAPYWFSAPLTPFVFTTGPQGFHDSGSRKTSEVYPGTPLLGFGSSSEDTQAPSRHLENLVTQTSDAQSLEHHSVAPPLRFLPLRRLSTQGSGLRPGFQP
jgi:hypothetical protein